MDALHNIDDINDYEINKRFKLNPKDVFPNLALKLLYEKQLLNTLNKAISDTAMSWYSYIYKKKKASSNSYESSDDNVISCIESFSEDFIKVLTSIITQSKNTFLREQVGLDCNSNGLNQSLLLDPENHSSESTGSNRRSMNPKTSRYDLGSPGSIFKSDLYTPKPKTRNSKIPNRKMHHSGSKTSRKNPMKNIDTDLSRYTKTCLSIQNPYKSNHHKSK